METFPPVAIGPHYILSADLVRYVYRNRFDLWTIGDLEDVSVGTWMFSLGARPEHLPWFLNAKVGPGMSLGGRRRSGVRSCQTSLTSFTALPQNSDCVENLYSYADLTPEAMRSIHANLEAGRKFCEGWGKDWIKL